jgi:hypothetical protein
LDVELDAAGDASEEGRWECWSRPHDVLIDGDEAIALQGANFGKIPGVS